MFFVNMVELAIFKVWLSSIYLWQLMTQTDFIIAHAQYFLKLHLFLMRKSESFVTYGCGHSACYRYSTHALVVNEHANFIAHASNIIRMRLL